jgi:hypothetical protein
MLIGWSSLPATPRPVARRALSRLLLCRDPVASGLELGGPLDATVKLITKAVSELKSNKLKPDGKIGRAEAQRRAMLALIKDGKDSEAHPAFWAPFTLVGQGAQ